MKYPFEFTQKLFLAYTGMCKPLCQELNIPQTAFDILMFLANNPEYQTARDIVEVRKMKANLVSVNVDRLVKEGYLERKMSENDRRRISLICTEKARPIIENGRKMQDAFAERMMENIPLDQKETFYKTLEMIETNLDTLKKVN